MLHEIQPGDVLIVTLADGGNTDSIGKHLSGMGISADIFVGSNATETSVHVLRAKKTEDTPKPDWPAWRDVRTAMPTPKHGELTLCYGTHGAVFVGTWSTALRDHITHWMPLPEGPKS